MLPYINIPFQHAADILEASPDELKLITSFLLSYPLAGLLKRLPDDKPALKNLFIIGVSSFYLFGLFDLWNGVKTLAVSSTFAYCAAKYIHSPFMPWITFVFVMGHLSINQLARQFVNDPGVMDITGAQMILAIKLTSFCWNVADGRLPDKDLSDFQKEKALRQLPSLLDYTGYVMFFPSLFAGPAFDFVDYKRWIETTMFDVPPNGSDPSKKSPTTINRKIPRSCTPAMWKAATGCLWIVLFLKLSAWYYPSLLTGDEYVTYGLARRIWILYMLGLTNRLKYYGVWTMTEGACILSGLGYNGVDPVSGKMSWDRIRHVNPWGVETAQNTRAYLGNWNINTNNWLRNYIYLRVTPRGQKPGFRASMATFVTSAFWHGFYPGYYLTFVLASFVQEVAKNFRRYIRPFLIDPQTTQASSFKLYYDIFSYLMTQISFSFITAPFVFLSLESSLLVWSRVYFYGVIGTALSTVFFASPAKRILTKKLKQQSANKASIDIQPATEEPLLGIPPEPQKIVDEVKTEIFEIAARKRAMTHHANDL